MNVFEGEGFNTSNEDLDVYNPNESLEDLEEEFGPNNTELYTLDIYTGEDNYD